MLNNERKFPKREPVWKPLFDILFAISLFSVPKELRPGKTAQRPRPERHASCRVPGCKAHAVLAPGDYPSVQEKSVSDLLLE
jgi:hypothetical protein